jgi:cytochrome c peroxidase
MMKSVSKPLALLLMPFIGLGMVQGALGDAAGGQVRSAELQAALADYQRPAKVPVPKANPMTADKIVLGQALFFDPRMSGSGALACASCHNPGLAWSDGLPKGLGHLGGRLGRHTPTVLNVAFGEPYFWDGRATTLEEQAKGPLVSPGEMNMPAADAVKRVQSIPGYVRMFSQAYPGQPISLDTIAAAIATFERTVVSATAPFDRWVSGDDAAVSDGAKRGFALFNGKANCSICHVGWRFSDDGFHDIGLPGTDPGRAHVAPGIVQLQQAFKTPTLRNVAQQTSYMHDGSLSTLAAVIEHYDTGFVRRPSLDTQMRPLNLSADEKKDLLAFLDTLTSVDPPVTVAALPH